jgi:hypothetical protein
VTLSADELVELAALVADAWEARGEARVAACERIADWHDALVFNRARRIVWHRQARLERLVALMRETDPKRLSGRRAA